MTAPMAASVAAPSLRKYLPVYFVLLGIFAVELFFAYAALPVTTLVPILLLLAICSATLAAMYFMHLAHERRGFFLSLITALVFVLLMMNMIWSDSYRLYHLKPFPQ